MDAGTHPIYREFAEALDLVEAKAHDYAEDDNVFSNFEFAAAVAGVETEQVFAVLLGVKVARLGQLIGKGKVPNFESVDDTLLDTMNYAGLLKAYMRAQSGPTIREAFQEAMEEEGEDEGRREVPYIGRSKDAEAEAAEQDWRGFQKGDIVQVRGSQGPGAIEYRITGVNATLGSLDCVPTKEWQGTLGDATRTFTAERMELV